MNGMTIHIGKMSSVSICLILFSLSISCQRNQEQNSSELQTPSNSINLSEAQIQLANIAVAEVAESEIGRRRLFTGVLKVNELSAVNISSRAVGRIQKLYFKNTGETVNIGDSLYQFYSNDLVTAEREYFTLHSNNWNFSRKYEPSLALENRLLLLGMLPSQIAQLTKDGKILFTVTIFSPVKGTIRSIKVNEGDYVEAGQTMFELADNRNFWVEAQIYPDDLPYLKVGTPTAVTIPATGNMPIKSNISFVNPSFEQGKNVTLVRALIDNRDKNLYPGMLALLNIQLQTNRGIVVPASAVIIDKTGSRVWIRNTDGSFSGRIVTTGIQSDDSVQIVSGLAIAESVVTSGAYLLNSELILKKGTVNE